MTEDVVIVTLDEEGNAEVEAHDQVKGTSCTELTGAFKQLGKETFHKKKASYYVKPVQSQNRISCR